MQKFPNTLWKFTRGKKNKDNFIQMALTVCKVFKVKPLKIPNPDIPSKKTAYNLFRKDIWKTKKELKGVTVFKASSIILKEWKKVKASEKKIKKYKDLYKKEKQRHEEALHRYLEDYMDEMEIINLHKRCNKNTRKVPQPKKASKSFNPDELKEVSEPTDGPSKEEQKPKKTNGKKTATKAWKKVKKTPRPKKAPKSPGFTDPSKKEEEEGPPKDNKRKKIPPLLGVKEEARSFFDLQKKSKNLTIEKKVEKVVFMAKPYEGYKLSYVALYDTKYLKKVLKMSGLEKKTKDLIKKALAKA